MEQTLKKTEYKAYRNSVWVLCCNLLVATMVFTVAAFALGYAVGGALGVVCCAIWYAMMKLVVLVEKLNAKVLQLERRLDDDLK